jgi:hypothetical protein
MSEPPIPETPTQQAQWFIGVLVTALVIKAVESFDTGNLYALTPFGFGAAAIILALVDFNLKSILANSPKLARGLNAVASDGRWWASMALATLLFLALSPYVQERRWPFSDWFPSTDRIADAVIQKLPKEQPKQTLLSPDDFAQAVVKAMREVTSNVQQPSQVKELSDALNAATGERNSLRSSVDQLTNELNKTRAGLSPKSPILGLDDAKRFQIIKALTDAGDSGCMITQAGLPLSPDGQRTWDTWGEVQQPLFYAGSRFTQNSKTFIGPGISITVGTKSGHGYECGRRLKDLLDGLNVRPVTFHIDEGEPDLIACKNECIQVTLGKLDSP